jgi:adenylate cyclase
MNSRPCLYPTLQPFELLESPEQSGSDGREELQQRIWPSDTFVDFDHGLYNAIKKLREALGDSADAPCYIETLSRRGYRFIAPVNGPISEPRRPAPAAAASLGSIAVLPFLNLSADPENEFFADGITEEIINALAQIEQLHVVARSSAFSFKGKHIDLRLIGEQLNVRTILEGSVRRAGNHLRITAQLVNVADGYHLWSERYDLEMKDIFEVQDAIARSIAERLRVSLEGKREEPLVRAGTKNLEAYQLYRGAAMLRAVKCFERAVALDPNYAIAWAGLADAHTVLGYYGLVPPAASMPKGTEAARRAVALDPSLAEAHNALAMCCLLHDWDLAAAEREFLYALKLNPRYVQAHCWYSLFYLQLAVGRAKEGVEHARLAVESDPLSGYANSMLGMTYSAAGRYTEAVEASERAVELDPDSFLARCSLQWALRFSRPFEDAAAACNSALAISGRHPWAMSSLAMILADWGKSADAESVYAEMMARARREYVAPAELAVAAAAVGMLDEAICHALEAFEIRDPFCRIQFTKYWPDSARLREDRRFQEILLKFGLD